MAPVPGDSPKTPVWHVDAARGPSTPSFDHFIGAGKQHRRHVEAETLSGIEIDHELKSRGLLDRQGRGLSALQDLVDVSGRVPELIGKARRITHQTSEFRKFGEIGYCGHAA